MVAVVLPDKNGSYKYYLEKRECCSTGCNLHYTTRLFQIIRDNKFNLKDAATKTCDEGLKIWYGAFSYSGAVRWCDFKSDYNKHLDAAYSRRDDVDSYNIVKYIIDHHSIDYNLLSGV
ncbi:MAG: hypothetical protein GX878_01490 [Firmicutes bacterium]|nr:hypothetical protein [Bacillota bacterium]